MDQNVTDNTIKEIMISILLFGTVLKITDQLWKEKKLQKLICA